MGVWGFGAMAERPLCVGGVNFGFFQFFGGGSDRIAPKQTGLTGKASWFLPLGALLGARLGCLIRVCSLVGVVSWDIGHQNGGVSQCVILRSLTYK